MSIVCQEIFDETSHPSVEEIKDYALKIGIDPDSEPQLLPLATEGLMKALPPGWKPCYDDKSKSYYYYNQITKKTQWEHPLDDIYRNLVKKVRAESQSLSINEPTEDATYAKEDELKSYEEMLPPDFPKLQPLTLGPRKRDIRLSPLKLSPAHSPRHESRLLKQRSEDILVGTNKFLHKFSSFDEDNKEMGMFDKHPRTLEKMELKVTGGGAMFLKSNTKKSELLPSPGQRSEGLDLPRGILRERAIEHSKSMDFDKVSLNDRSDKDDDDKKSVRFNLDNNTTDVGITFSDKSSSDEDILSDKQPKDETAAIKTALSKNRFSVSPVVENPSPTLRLIKVPPDFVRPKLTINTGSDSDEDTKSLEKLELKTIEDMFDSDSSSVDDKVKTKLEKRAEQKVTQVKQKIWEEKNEELVNFKQKLDESHQHELDRILENEKSKHEEAIKTELDNCKAELEVRTKEERLNFDSRIKDISAKMEEQLESDREKISHQYELKKDELEKYYDEKLAEIEKELADRVEKQKQEMSFNHNADIEQLRQNHSIIIEEIKREFTLEEQIMKQEHQVEMLELKRKLQSEAEAVKSKHTYDDRQFEKMRCEKRLLEDKYRCLKEKYLRLKTEVKLSLEKRSRRKEQNSTNTTATNTTGSETEQSHSNNKDRTPLNSPSRKLLEKPPTPGQSGKLDTKVTKVIIQDLDTSVSDNCYQSDDKGNPNDSSDSINPGRSRKKLFSRKNQQRSCSPVENLRKQLQKLEDLEDQFPQNSQCDTYHLSFYRYPFSDGQPFEGSSELEFFRHRIHLERDSIKRAKESLRSQKALFQQRQKELKLKHGSMARHTLQQLCQEEKELTDMEVNLHRTRSLLGEKVIRLRHLEQSLHRANAQNDQSKLDDATLSDLSSHSASSGISSTEFVVAEGGGYYKAISKADFQEPSEIIQSLENLNLEIREIWGVLRTQHQQSSIAQVMPPLVYPDLGWPVLAGAASVPAPPSIPTLADRLHNYRQQVALANAQSTVVTHASQGATTTLIERTRNLRHWLRQTGSEACNDNINPSKTNL
ncbi:centrosomal protein of 164 kDa isoform X3 [Dendroctonus ponderosae]|uniref:centrosomal protein of 164 kDa isoform X3 n=1 Tax=Dendroctonus ponderosae TaxID=77166 RepID=UPI002034B7B8|nr:centrosomal protein of 164 kDa isoform X3 [Dendroctonus ponderosae]